MIGYYLAVRAMRGGWVVTNATDSGFGNVVARMDATTAINKAIKRKIALGTYATAAEAESVLLWLMGERGIPDVEPMGEIDGDFPARLTAIRTAAGLSIPDLARSSGLSDDVLRQYEKGTRAPTWDSVQKLAAALGVPTDAFRESK